MNTRAVATGSRYRPQKQRPPLAVEGRRAGKGVSARGAHRSTTALGLRPGLLSLRPVAATPKPRTKRGLCSSRLEESGPLATGQAGACGEGLRVELHLHVSALLPGPGRFAVGTDPVSNFPSFRTGPGSSGVPVPPPSPLWPLTPGNSHLQPLTPAHSLQGRWGRGGAFVSLRTPGWNILVLHSLKCLT